MTGGGWLSLQRSHFERGRPDRCAKLISWSARDETDLAERIRSVSADDEQFRNAETRARSLQAAARQPRSSAGADLRDVRRGLRRPSRAWAACALADDRSQHRPHHRAAAAPVRHHQLPRAVGQGARDRARLAARRRPIPSTAGDVVATIGFASPDYLVVDLVCAYLGLVAVPLQHNAPASRLRPIIAEMRTQDRRRQRGLSRPCGRVGAEQSVGAAG